MLIVSAFAILLTWTVLAAVLTGVVGSLVRLRNPQSLRHGFTSQSQAENLPRYQVHFPTAPQQRLAYRHPLLYFLAAYRTGWNALTRVGR